MSLENSIINTVICGAAAANRRFSGFRAAAADSGADPPLPAQPWSLVRTLGSDAGALVRGRLPGLRFPYGACRHRLLDSSLLLSAKLRA